MKLPTFLLLVLGALPLSGAQCATTPAPYLGVAPQGIPSAGKHFASTTCLSCHGMHGNSVSLTFPNLAGQNYNYLLKQLEQFRSGARKASPMNAMIGTVPKAKGDKNLMDIAAYYAQQKLNRKANANAHVPKLTKAEAKDGYDVYMHGIPSTHVPSCDACHGSDGTGMAPMAIPSLAGQHAAYIEKELKLFANGKRHNSPGHVMAMIAKRLSPKQIKDVALYAQALHPGLVPGRGPNTYQAYVKALSSQPVPGVPESAMKSANPPSSSAGK